MSICILFILFNGSGYITPACYEGHELITPHNVAYMQHIPVEYGLLYESPDYYLNYYWQARSEYCSDYYADWSWCATPQYLATIYYYSVPYHIRPHLNTSYRHHYQYFYKNKNHHKRHKHKYKRYDTRSRYYMKHNARTGIHGKRLYNPYKSYQYHNHKNKSPSFKSHKQHQHKSPSFKSHKQYRHKNKSPSFKSHRRHNHKSRSKKRSHRRRH